MARVIENPPDIAYEKAIQDLSGVDLGKQIEIKFMGSSLTIHFQLPEVIFESSGEITREEKIILLHYIAGAGKTPLSGRLIDFRQVPSGLFYHSVFAKRVKVPLTKTFGRRPERLVELAGLLGGGCEDYADIAVRIPVLPRVPLIIGLWLGDDEFSPDANVLFDSTVSGHLSTEDITILSEQVVKRLIVMEAGS